MERVRLAGLILVLLLVLVLVGSMLAGLGGAGEAPEERRGAPSVPERGARVRVEVLNAAGIAGLARSATDRLRDAGFDVVDYGNAASFGRDTSWVIDRVGAPEIAARVAEALEIGDVRSDPDSTLYVDVTVLIGRNWVGAPTAEVADSAGGG